MKDAFKESMILTSKLIKILERSLAEDGDMPVALLDWDSSVDKRAIGFYAICPDPLPIDAKPTRLEIWFTREPSQWENWV